MRSRAASLIGTALFLVVAPGSVTGLIPWWITGWSGSAGTIPMIAGAALIVAGGAILLESFIRFAWVGIGTPAPVAPTQSLIVSGFYRHVRNPMYVAVIAIILGQALALSSGALLVYGAAIWLAVHLFVMAYEEPVLAARYGAEYARYCANVPRWLPRLTPWHG